MVCEIDGELFPPVNGSSGSAVRFLMDEDEARRWYAAEELTRAAAPALALCRRVKPYRGAQSLTCRSILLSTRFSV